MENRFKLTIVIFTLLVTSIQIHSQDTFNLGYKLEKGKTFFYKAKQNQEMTMDIMGQETNTKTEAKMKLRMQFGEISSDKFEILSSYDSLYLKAGNPTGGDDIVSNGENIVGKKSKTIYDKYGKKIQTIEIDPIVIESMTSPNFGNMFFQLSDKPVKVGDVWKAVSVDTMKAGGAGKIITKSSLEYKIEGKEIVNGSDCLKISYSGTMKIEGTMTQQAMDIVMEGTGKENGVFFFNISKGLVHSTDNQLDMNITMAIASVNMTIPMNQKIKTSSVYSEN